MIINYRAITELNTQVRRLAYVSQLLRLVGHKPLSKQSLLSKLIDWSASNSEFLENHLDSTGAVHSEKQRKNTAALRYIDFAMGLGVLTRIANMYRPTRIGAVLSTMLYEISDGDENPFCLKEHEKIFFLYQLFQRDADLLLCVVDMIRQGGSHSLKDLQNNFQVAYLDRLIAKIAESSQEHIKRLLSGRRNEIKTTWKNPKRYAEHIVPPRLHWLLDMGFVQLTRQSGDVFFHFTDAGKRFVDVLPRLSTADISEVTDEWQNKDFFSSVCPSLFPFRKYVYWKDADECVRHEVIQKYIVDAFKEFRRTSVPKISLTQGMLYTCIRSAVDSDFLVDKEDLLEWFSTPRVFDDHRYEVRTSARENEAYFIMMRV
ncbi:TPA: hypothetical protein EYP66_07455 [Candidatus Poribacteria bacterium]|nr:hypothetical protein [Candidatus Poribacteria bacterium]